MVDEQPYLDALRRESVTPQDGAPDSLRLEGLTTRDGPDGVREVVVRYSFVPYPDDPRPRTSAGRIEGEAARSLDQHPTNDFREPAPFADALWHQAGLEADSLMRAAYDVAPSAPTSEHAARATALIPTEEEFWQLFLDELVLLGRVLEQDSRTVVFESWDRDRVTFAFGSREWHTHLHGAVVRELAAGYAIERRGGVNLQGYWDQVFELIGSGGGPVVVLGRHGLESRPEDPRSL